jgi:uncharacterized protein (TIGR03435 family)
MLACDVREFQISGGPGWVNSDRYNIEAKAEAKPAYDQRWVAGQKQMLQSLLRERFRLAMHRETKKLLIYQLTVTKGGLKLQPLKDGSCFTFDPNNPTPPPGKTPVDYCGSGGFMGRGRYEASSASMADLAMAFSLLTGRTVVDKTGITGVFPVQCLSPTRACSSPLVPQAMQETLRPGLTPARPSLLPYRSSSG